MIPAARKFDAKKEVDTARAASTSFFVACFPWAAFPWAFSVGGSMHHAAGEIAADLDRPRRVDADDSSPARAGSMRAAYPTTPPTLHSIGEMHRPPRRVDADGTPRRGDRAAHATHNHAAGVDAGQDAAARPT